jgi:transcriptional regulator with XRE-family HTH domain
MGSSKWTDKRFGERIKAEREDRGWSQADMAKALSTVGVHSMHPTTIAKIEAGDRSVRINEAVGIADLFEVSLDALLDRDWPDDSALMFALRVLAGYAGNAKRQIAQARDVAADIEDQLEDAARRFDSPQIKALSRLALEMAEHLDAAEAQAQQIDSITTQAIAAAVEEASR